MVSSFAPEHLSNSTSIYNLVPMFPFNSFQSGNSTDSIFLPKQEKGRSKEEEDALVAGGGETAETSNDATPGKEQTVSIPIGPRKKKRRHHHNNSNLESSQAQNHHSNLFTRRRHAADETAFLFAKALAAGVRTIAFCKTRSLVEWVLERTISILQSNPDTKHLASKVESYRGGYTADARRSIEERLFTRKLWGVVGTNGECFFCFDEQATRLSLLTMLSFYSLLLALELGIDIGGVDLTLHTGYPGSISSLLQQSGRAGRGKTGLNVASCAICVCFSSPSEQYIWKNPTTLLSRGVNAPPTLPINGTVMQGHLLCAGEEHPLTGDQPVSCSLNEFGLEKESCPADCELLGPPIVYENNVQLLIKKGLLSCKKVRVVSGETSKSKGVTVHSTHPVSLCHYLLLQYSFTMHVT